MEAARVIDARDWANPHPYASGEPQGESHDANDPRMASVSWGCVVGRIAGRHLAEQALLASDALSAD